MPGHELEKGVFHSGGNSCEKEERGMEGQRKTVPVTGRQREGIDFAKGIGVP